MNEFELGKELSTVEADINSLRNELDCFRNTYGEGVDVDNGNFKLVFDELNRQNKKDKNLEARMVKNDLICLGYTLFVGLVCLVTTHKVTKKLREDVDEVENRMSKYDAELKYIRAQQDRDRIQLHEEILKAMNGFTSTTITNNRL